MTSTCQIVETTTSAKVQRFPVLLSERGYLIMAAKSLATFSWLVSSTLENHLIWWK